MKEAASGGGAARSGVAARGHNQCHTLVSGATNCDLRRTIGDEIGRRAAVKSKRGTKMDVNNMGGLERD